jgi:hypothetical protein
VLSIVIAVSNTGSEKSIFQDITRYPLLATPKILLNSTIHPYPSSSLSFQIHGEFIPRPRKPPPLDHLGQPLKELRNSGDFPSLLV